MMRAIFASLLLALIVLTPNLSHAQDGFEPGEIRLDDYGFEMIYVPGATVEIGIAPDRLREYCRDYGESDPDYCVEVYEQDAGVTFVETVQLPSFWIDRYEVTAAQFQRLCASLSTRPYYGYGSELCASASVPPGMGYSEPEPDYPQGRVNWYLAAMFCQNREARLPSEAEWEYAASGPDKLIFPWGNTVRWDYANHPEYPSQTYPVGSIPENRSWIGVYDMAGNVAEWTSDLYLPRILRHTDFASMPPYYPHLDTAYVIRGGGPNNPPIYYATFYRRHELPDVPDQFVGIRCARFSPPDDEN
jgi:formylglycine-generating enzyme required for sulfatase activity